MKHHLDVLSSRNMNMNLMSFSHISSKLTLFFLALLLRLNLKSVFAATCEYDTLERNKLYSYSLSSPINNFPHGVLSEDGFYKVAANDTIIWFQLCDGMIFNHDPPRCVDCWAIMHAQLLGIKQTLTSILQDPETLKKLGTCHYATELRHPAGCPKIAAHATGWGWFGILLTILLCSIGAYLLIGGVYRFSYLGIRGLDVIPSLDFWISIPHRIKSVFMSLVQRFRGPTYHHRSSYSSVNF
ncbi:uncharacterized protein LOC104905961 isoform X2 [Beta vulgaris subsp. vulgaris]|uniref:uncharacterized protein LOC104905961 isoform X2 n=1 Tax=Beta vulgaris subsp. vulgaris TaxID=3555 RepID=UPI00254813C4|nr:uncharacterized protein LOC104905961 isoform X2 [Beta vulgaris subsp. vulgaris]